MATHVEGEFWFELGEAAKLMRISRRKLEVLVAGGKIRALQSPDGPDFDLVAEEDVTRRRRATGRGRLAQ